MKKNERDGLIAGVKICPQAPCISHLLFADDSLILIRATEGDSKQLQNTLRLYEQCSGQMINKAKSVVLFSKNTKQQQRRVVCENVQVFKETMSERYLGLPIHVGKSKLGVLHT